MAKIGRSNRTLATAGGGYTSSTSRSAIGGVHRKRNTYKVYSPTGSVLGTQTTDESELETPSVPGFGGSPGTVMVLGTTLLIAVTWDSFWKPFFTTLFFGTPFQPPQSWNIIIGGFIAIGIASIFAAQSEDIAGVISLALIAMWLVFITMSGSPVIKEFVDFFTTGIGTNNISPKTGEVSMKVPNPSAPTSPKLTTL